MICDRNKTVPIFSSDYIKQQISTGARLGWLNFYNIFQSLFFIISLLPLAQTANPKSGFFPHVNQTKYILYFQIRHSKQTPIDTKYNTFDGVASAKSAPQDLSSPSTTLGKTDTALPDPAGVRCHEVVVTSEAVPWHTDWQTVKHRSQ